MCCSEFLDNLSVLYKAGKFLIDRMGSVSWEEGVSPVLVFMVKNEKGKNMRYKCLRIMFRKIIGFRRVKTSGQFETTK